ncbi:RICIN domain-containing protein [Micromonospora chokoriensis]
MYRMRWATGAVLLVCGGVLVACQSDPSADPVASGSASASASATTTPSSSLAPATTIAPVLSGTREVTIVRVQATEGAIALDGNLTEVDDDSGRQLFVPTPLGDDTYLIKAYGKADNHPANDEPACWQVNNPGNTQPLTVEGAVCDPKNPAQRFTITASGKGAYAISNRSAYLQHSRTNGMILEEVADGPVPSTFRFVDNGPARRPAGG